MGKVMSRLNRQFYRFNAENRAHREISKEKLKPAPRHPTEEKAIREILEQTKHIKEQEMKKDPTLDEFLKKVFVVSHDPVQEKKKKPSEKGMLPLSRTRPEETELGYYEPDIIPKGKITLKQAMKILADNQGDPAFYNETKISTDYGLNKDDAVNLLEYFSSFKIFVKEDVPQLTGTEKLKSFFSSKSDVKSLPEKSEG